MIEELFTEVIKITLTTSVIIGFLIAITPILNKKYTAKWRCFVWLILALRLIIPIDLTLPKTPIKINVPIVMESQSYTLSSQNSPQIQTQDKTLNDTTTKSVTQKSLPNAVIPSPLKLTSMLWILGSLIFITYYIIGNTIFRRTLKRWSMPIKDKKIIDAFNKLSSDMKISKPISIMTCKKITSPMMTGFIKPVILLPMEALNFEDLTVILKHELIHFKRHDLWYKLLMIIANSIHWFNPLVYLMINEANKDVEISCDDEVVRNMDKSYKIRYSETILSVMNSKPNSKILLSTNFNGGIKTMKRRFQNIFNNSKKHKGIASLCLILTLTIIGSALVACGKSNNSSPEDTAKAFLKGYYEVKDYSPLDEFDSIMEKVGKDPENDATTSSTGGDLVPFSEDTEQELQLVCLKQINDYITEDLGSSLISSRFLTRKYKTAKEFNYTLQVKEIALENNGSKDNEKNYLKYKTVVILTYPDGNTQEQTLKGTLKLIKENDQWHVSIFNEISGVSGDKSYYKPLEETSTNIIDGNTSTGVSYSTADELCNSYIQAMLESNYSFIYAYTMNASKKSTSIDEGQKIWDTTKVEDVKIIKSDVRDSKAFYELEINVTDPGASAFGEGKNQRWLYIASGKKGDVIHWYVESLVSDGEPDANWWNIIQGG